jgi:hypothetical protein
VIIERWVHAGKVCRCARRPKYGLERNLETAGTVKIIASLTTHGLGKIHCQRHIVRHRRNNATRYAPVDTLRGTVRDRPIVDDQRHGCRAELDDAAVSDQIVLRRQIEIGADDPAIDRERGAELHAGACDQRFRGLRADRQCQHWIAGFGVAVHSCTGVGQATDRADLGLASVEQVTDLAAGNEARSIGVRSDGVDDAGARVAEVLPAECGEPLREEVLGNTADGVAGG